MMKNTERENTVQQMDLSTKAISLTENRTAVAPASSRMAPHMKAPGLWASDTDKESTWPPMVAHTTGNGNATKEMAKAKRDSTTGTPTSATGRMIRDTVLDVTAMQPGLPTMVTGSPGSPSGKVPTFMLAALSTQGPGRIVNLMGMGCTNGLMARPTVGNGVMVKRTGRECIDIPTGLATRVSGCLVSVKGGGSENQVMVKKCVGNGKTINSNQPLSPRWQWRSTMQLIMNCLVLSKLLRISTGDCLKKLRLKVLHRLFRFLRLFDRALRVSSVSYQSWRVVQTAVNANSTNKGSCWKDEFCQQHTQPA